jgi:hypothetical protein
MSTSAGSAKYTISKSGYTSGGINNFSSSMNNTLNQMKRKY